MAGIACDFYYNGTLIGWVDVIGIGDLIPYDIFLNRSQSLNLPEGHIFDGWYTTETFDEGTKVVGDYTVTGKVHFYAKVIAPATVASTLTSLADEIRVLSGTTEPLGLTEMATNVNDANDEVISQTDLIAQLASALQGKSVPGGGEDVTAETATYTDLLTDLEAAVDALPDAGGGGGSGGADSGLSLLGNGQFTGDGTSAYVLSHGLGVIPKALLVHTNYSASYTMNNITFLRMSDGETRYLAAYSRTTNATTVGGGTTSLVVWGDETVTLTGLSSCKYYNGATYNWYAFG